jgi:NAD-dependent deacetylase
MSAESGIPTFRDAQVGLGERFDPLELATWQRRPGVDLTIVTQNVDDRHERAGSTVLAHVHGRLFALRCSACGLPSDAAYPDLAEPVGHRGPPSCPAGGGRVGPGVVWVDEALPVVEVNPRERAMSEATDEGWRAPAASALRSLVDGLAPDHEEGP